MKQIAILLIVIAIVMLTIGFLPDPAETIQFHYVGTDIIDQLGVDRADDDVFTDAEKTFLENIDLSLDLRMPRSVLSGRKGHVALTTAMQTTPDNTDSFINSTEFKLQIKSNLDLPRQFLEPAGTIFKDVSPTNVTPFYWNILSESKTSISGNLWVYIIAMGASGESIEYPLLSREIEVPVRSILGMNLKASRIVSLMALIAGSSLLIFKKFGIKKWFDKN